MRWEYHWRNYTNEQGYVMPAEEFWNAWRQKNQSKTNRNAIMSLPVSNWQPIGPFTHTNTGSWSSGQGRVNIVHVDPSNPNTIYLGAPAGGIWKSTIMELLGHHLLMNYLKLVFQELQLIIPIQM
jgi:hypothetical protein